MIILPMAVVRSGKRHSSAATPLARRCSTSFWHCVLLPARSAPSNTMKAPRGCCWAAMAVQERRLAGRWVGVEREGRQQGRTQRIAEANMRVWMSTRASRKLVYEF